MKILCVSSRYARKRASGSRTYIRGLCGGLAANGHQVTVFTSEPEPDGAVKCVRHPHWGFDVAHTDAAGDAFRAMVEAADVVIVNRAEPATVWHCIRHAKQIVAVASSRASLNGQFVGITGWMDLFDRAAVVLVPGSRVGEELVARGLVRASQVGVMPGGFNPPPPFDGDKAYDWMQNVPTLATVGRINWTKGQSRVIKAWRTVLESIPGAVYVVAGPDETNGEIQALADREGVGESVIFTGSLSGLPLWTVYRNAQVTALLTSLDAGEPPLSVTESMSFGTPVIVSDDPRGCCKSVAGAAVIVNGDDVAGLAAAIVDLLTDEAIRRHYSVMGERFARAKTWGTLAAKLEEWVKNGSTA